MRRHVRLPGRLNCLCSACVKGILGQSVPYRLALDVAPLIGLLPWRLP